MYIDLVDNISPSLHSQVIEYTWNYFYQDYVMYDIANFADFENYWYDHCSNSTFVAIDEKNKELFGFVSLVQDDLGVKFDDGLLVCSLYVLPQYRQKNVGSSLLKHIIDYCKNYYEHSDVKSLYLWTGNLTLINWYERNGFQVHSYIDEHLGYEPICVMKHELVSNEFS